MAGRPRRRHPHEPFPTCKYVQVEATGATCRGVVSRDSDYCEHHSQKLSEQWAGVYADRADDGQTFDVALSFPFLDRRLGDLTTEERRGLGLYLQRRYPLLGEDVA